MQIRIIVIGKTDKAYLNEGIALYLNRIRKYVKLEWYVLADIKQKNLPEKVQKEKEGELLKSKLNKGDYIVLLDERGKKKSSVEFAQFMQQKMMSSTKHLVLIVGGPYGFSDEIIHLANEKLSLSPMTFSHQMVRLILVEQLYRAFTIIKGEPYHHA